MPLSTKIQDTGSWNTAILYNPYRAVVQSLNATFCFIVPARAADQTPPYSTLRSSWGW